MIYSVDSALYQSFLISKKSSSSGGKSFETGGKRISMKDRGAGMEDGRSG
jgi:hypothetical protein